MIPAPFEYLAPSSMEEALALLSAHGEEAKLLAGGQSLLPLMKLRLAQPSSLIDLARIPGLAGIRPSDARSEGSTGRPTDGNRSASSAPSTQHSAPTLTIGAMTCYAEIEESDLLRRDCPLLPQTASVVADLQVRNRGTIGGSLAHADPTGDVPAAILALDGELEVRGPTGERLIRAEDFFTGFFTTVLAPDEILTRIRVPVLTGWRVAYLKASPRASGFAIAGVAVCLRLGDAQACEEVRVGVTGVSDKPFRAYAVEDALRGRVLGRGLIGEAAAAVTEGLWVMDDVRASADYRAHLARLYTRRAIEAACG